MLKRILVALDRDTDTPIATRYAIKLAKSYDASLTGLVVVDLETISEVVGGGGIGTIHFAKQLKKDLTEKSRKEATKLLQKFKDLVESSNVNHSKLIFEGVPHERIIEESKYHDLLIIGRESHFFYNRPDHDTKTLANLVKNGVGPTLMVTDSYRPISRVLVAHDGSHTSARALQWFVQLEPFGRDVEIDIINACNKEKQETAEQGEYVINLAYDYLKAHNYDKVSKQLIDDKGGAGQQIIAYAKDTKADLIIIGAHSKSAIRRITFGSVTRELVKNSPVPLFLTR
ncbi:MAG: universal stress protein [Balneolaceae bacterium]